MKRSRSSSRAAKTWLIWLSLLVGLSACGESATPLTVSPAPPVTIPSTAFAPPATSTTTVAPSSTAVVTLAATAAGQSTPPVATVEPAVAPTITTGPTPAPAPLTASWVKDGVCYEVFVRSFFDSNGDGKGDLNGLIAKLDYLNDGNPASTKSLGVNCLWLMPVTASPSYHGYDTTDYFKINPDYGTNEDFKRLMQEAHKRGIYVITDLVLNHTSNQYDWFKQATSSPQSSYRDWYIFNPINPGYRGPWGDQAWWPASDGANFYYGLFGKDLPDLNFRNPAVTKQMDEVTRYWLQEMGVDGFRLDAAKHLIEDGRNQQNTPETHAWLRDFRKFYSSIKPTAFTIGEINGPATELNGYYPDQLDAYFEFSLAQSFVKSASNGQASFVGLVKDADSHWPLQRYGTFLTNHDQTRVMSVLEDPAKMKMAATAYLTSPGLPFVYYGEEIGMRGAKPDPQIRTPMQWSGANQGGFTTGTAWEALQPETAQVNVQEQESDPNSLLNLYRNLIHLRRVHPALAQGSFTPLTSSAFGVAAYLRHTDREDVLVVINMTNTAVTDLKLSADQTDLVEGRYTSNGLLTINMATPTPVVVQAGKAGAISDFAPLANLPAHSATIFSVKK